MGQDARLFAIRNPPVQTLLVQRTNFDLHRVDPTRVLRTERGLVQREVVEHHLHGLGIRIMDFDQFTRAVGAL